MSDLTTQTTTRRERARVWFNERKAAGIQWLFVLTAVAFVSVSYEAGWFLGVVALAWHHIVPTIKWYYSVGTNPDGSKKKRNLRWSFGRFGIFAATATVFGVLWYSEGFQIAVILPILVSISIPLFKKRDWTMLGAIWVGVVLFAEFSNGASLAAAILISALVQYERRKVNVANRKARRENLFEERDLSQRPTHLGATGGGLRDRVHFDQPAGYQGEDHPTGPIRVPQDLEDPHGQTGTHRVIDPAVDGPPRRERIVIHDKLDDGRQQG